jgi:hypothetical protein
LAGPSGEASLKAAGELPPNTGEEPLAHPNIAGAFGGTYTFGAGYRAFAGKTVQFSVTIQQLAGSENIKGVTQEPYLGFGTPKEGKVWADIRGTCRHANGKVEITFDKIYRTIKQPPTKYFGILDPNTGLLTGTWEFAEKPELNGRFQFNNVKLKSITSAAQLSDGALQTQNYPPAGGTLGTVLEAPGGQFRLEQWGLNAGGNQIWMVGKNGETARLPAVPLPAYRGNSDTVGVGTEFNFSQEGKYLLCGQKIAHGERGVYLYRQVKGPVYEVLIPDLYLRASAFFTRATKFSWYYGSGIVEFSAWQPDGGLALTLRGAFTPDKGRTRSGGVAGWRCVLSPETGDFSIPADWTAANTKAISKT